jgi:hypothetical protein
MGEVMQKGIRRGEMRNVYTISVIKPGGKR